MSKSLEILKKYSNDISLKDYVLIKKELKILELYRKYTLLSSVDDEINIRGEFFIHDDCDEDFEYFRKNEYLK